MGEYDTWLAILRFFHVISGILWIGLLYYFNLVQVPSFAKMDAAARANAVQHLASRALFFFRYSALSTVVFGIAWIILNAIYLDDELGVNYFEEDTFKSIMIGGGLGIIMFLNVWGIIWPNQKKIIAATTATATRGAAAPADQPKWARMATLASRTNVMLSIPMLFFMISAGHLSGRLWN
jgi:uncharacterized membrane protein